MVVSSKTRKKVEWFLRRAEGLLLSDGLLADHGAHLDPKTARGRLGGLSRELAELHLDTQAEELARAIDGDAAARAAYAATYGVSGVRKFSGGHRTKIFQLAVETFP